MKTLRIGSLQEIKRGVHKGKRVKIIGRGEKHSKMYYIALGEGLALTDIDFIKDYCEVITLGKVYEGVDKASFIEEEHFSNEEIHFDEEEKVLVGTTQVIAGDEFTIIPSGTEVEIIGLVDERSVDGCPLYLVKWGNGYSIKNCSKVIYYTKETLEDEKVWTVYGRYLSKGANNE